MQTLAAPALEVTLTFQRDTHNCPVVKFKNEPTKAAVRNFSELYDVERPFIAILKKTTESGWVTHIAQGFPTLEDAHVFASMYPETDNSTMYSPQTGKQDSIGGIYKLVGIADSGTVPAAVGDEITVYYRTSMMGSIVKQEGKLRAVGRKPYAQYPNAGFVEYVPKRKRNGLRLFQTFQPYMLVLKGHGHPNPTDLFGVVLAPSTDSTLEMRTTTYGSFSGGWVTDFEKKINPYLAAQKQNIVVADFREWLGE